MKEFTKIRDVAAWLIGVTLLISVSRLGSILHESDQASVTLGALKLLQGNADWLHPGFYEYGNYFLSYWILAGCCRLFPFCNPVFLGNVVSLTVFWSGALWLFVAARRRSFLFSSVFFAALASPAVLVHVSYFAPVFLSAGFLFAGAAALVRFPGRFPLTVGLWAAAFACRSDALLLIPVMAWLSVGEKSFVRLVCSRRSWTLVVIGAVVLLCGRLLDSGNGLLEYQFFFYPKVYFSYLVFGAGGAFFSLLLILWMLGVNGRRTFAWDERLFWWSAVPALLLSFVFYSLLMFTPRHWVLMISAQLLLFSSSKLVGAWLLGRKTAIFLICLTVVPMVAGLRLPAMNCPSLTVSRPELFPTTDGRFPMGALASFLFSGQRLDHNHRTWLAAQEVGQWREIDGVVPLASSPLVDILQVSVLLNGQIPVMIPAGSRMPSFFYTTGRSLTKSRVSFDSQSVSRLHAELEKMDLFSVGGVFPCSVVLLEQREGDKSWDVFKKRVFLLRQIFKGNEVRWIGMLPEKYTVPDSLRGRSVLFFSDRKFSAIVDGAEYISSVHEIADGRFFWVLVLPPNKNASEIIFSSPVFGASTVYPDYMQIRNF